MNRSKWKFLVVDYKFLKKLKERKNSNKIKQIIIKTRKVSILPIFIKNNLEVYNGKSFFRFKATFLNISHKIGSFIFTRKIYNLPSSLNKKNNLKNKKPKNKK